MASNNPNEVKEEKNIHVVLRCRPGHQTMGETSSDNKIVWNALSKKVVEMTQGNEEEPQQWDKFDEAFRPAATQMEVSCRLVSPILGDVFFGCKCTIIAYGQRGTGKTFTMMGEGNPGAGFAWNEDSQAGIIPRALHHMFQRLSGTGIDASVKVSLCEMYNEELFDLLRGDDAVEPQHLQLCNDPQVDLASGESLTQGSDSEEELREASEIKKSLLALGCFIASLAKRKKRAIAQGSSSVPHRDSILMRVLQDSLGGRTKTTIVATVPEYSSDPQGTQGILENASMARKVFNNVGLNHECHRSRPMTSASPGLKFF